MLTNMGKCLAYNQRKGVAQNYVYNKSIYCKQMHFLKKDYDGMHSSHEFARSTAVGAGILVKTFLCLIL